MNRTGRLTSGLRVALWVGLVCLLGDAIASRAARPADAEAGQPGKSSTAPPDSFFATTLGRSNFDIVLVHYWSNGAKFRAETIVLGHPIITVVSDGWYYTWDGLTGEGYAIRRDAPAIASDGRRPRPFGLELQQMLDQDGTKIRSESLNGIDVDVYRVSDDAGQRTLWVDAEQFDLPVRLESFDRATGRTGTLDWISWIPGIAIPDSFFAPDAELSLTRFESHAAYLEARGQTPLPPAPPLFHYLLQQAAPR